MMRRLLILLFFSCSLWGGAQNVLPNVDVFGKRPLKEVGVNKTVLDSLMLKENAALSMADILAFNSALYVKNFGRATLSTVSFRGTSPAHTQVTWNGMRINNPMLGMTDFSTIPAFFVDKADLLHGSSSVNETGGALGGVVQLRTTLENTDSTRHSLRYVQGIGSFRTCDEFLRYSWTGQRWGASTRFALSSSPNDYTYINRDKKINIYDDDHNIIGQYYPKERNRSGAYRDLNLMQQVEYNTGRGDRFSLDVWYVNSNRELPVLTTDYGDERQFDNRQREQTVRAVMVWRHNRPTLSVYANAGYAYTNLKYDYKREITEGNWSVLTRSRSRVNTAYVRGEINWFGHPKWFVNAALAFHQHFVLSHDKNIILVNGSDAIVGYDKARTELSGNVSVKWQPIPRLGLGVTAREDVFGDRTAFIPAFFADAMLMQRPNLMLKGSVSRNHKFPTLNDMYFLPGGNPDLRSEKGLTYDIGFGAEHSSTVPFTMVYGASANWFDSFIDDWILWLPTTKGFFSPRNVRKVHAYGIEARLHADASFGRGWTAALNATYSWTPSVNRGEPLSDADKSVGRQLPYVPRHSAAFTARLVWRSWSLLYKWSYYSRRFTMSSNEFTLTGSLPPYFMNNIVVQKDFRFRPLDIQLKLAINNLFNEEYLSVLSHPMPGINFEFFIGINPKF